MARGKDDSARAPWDALRDQAVTALEEFTQSAVDAPADLRTIETALDGARRHLIGGGRAADMTEIFDIPSLRSSLTDQLERVERARMAGRRALWRMQLAEGATIADVARSWGLSRQLVSRALSNHDPKLSR